MWSHETAVPQFLRVDQRSTTPRVCGETSVFYLPSTTPSAVVNQIPQSPFDSPVSEDVIRWLEELRHETADTPGDLVRAPFLEANQEQEAVSTRSNYNPWAYEDQRRSAQITRQLEEFIESCVQSDQFTQESPELALQGLLPVDAADTFGSKLDEHIQIWEGLKVPRVFGLNSTPSLNTRLSAEANLSGTAFSEDGLINRAMDSAWYQASSPTTKERGGRPHPASCISSPHRSPASPSSSASASASASGVSMGENVLNAANFYNVPRKDLTPSPREHAQSPSSTLPCEPQKLTSFVESAKDDVVDNEGPESNKRYENIMNNLDAIISKFEEIKEKIRLKETDAGSNSGEDRPSLKDSELIKMCETAELIIEETLSREGNREKKPKRAAVAQTTSTSSDVSDDVFLNDLRADRARDIDRIFDQEPLPRTQPPEPPKRKKKANTANCESPHDLTTSRGFIQSPMQVSLPGVQQLHQLPKMTEDRGIHATEKSLTSLKKPVDGSDLKDAIKNARDIIDNCQMICMRETQSDINKMFEAQTSGQAKLSSKPSGKPFGKQSFKFSGKTTDPLPSPPPSPPPAPQPLTPLPTPPPSPEPSPTQEEDVSTDLKIHLTPTRTISSLTFPASDDHPTASSVNNSLRVMGPCPLAPSVPNGQRSIGARMDISSAPEVPNVQRPVGARVECPTVPEVPYWQRSAGPRVECPTTLEVPSEERSGAKVQCPAAYEVSSGQRSAVRVVCPIAPEVTYGQRSAGSRVEIPTSQEVTAAQRSGARMEYPMASEAPYGQRSAGSRVECPTAPQGAYGTRSAGERVKCPTPLEVPAGYRSGARVECPMAPELPYGQRLLSARVECPTVPEVPHGQQSAVTVESPVSAETQQSVLETRRKGSNASDVTAWKQTLQSRGTNTFSYHDEEFHPHSMLSQEWFSSNPVQESSQPLPTSVEPWISPENSSLLGSPALGTQDKPSVATITKLIEAELRGKQHPRRTDKVKSLIGKTVGYTIGDEQKDGVTFACSDPWNENTAIIREGILNRTKITENGKKIRKNWMSSFAVLTETYLLFFKDVKTFNAMKIGKEPFRPDMALDVSVLLAERDDKLTSRKNVLVVGTPQGLQILMQTPSSVLVDQWLASIKTANSQMSGNMNSPRNKPRKVSPQDAVSPTSAGSSPSSVSMSSTLSDEMNRSVRPGAVWPIQVAPTTESIEDLTSVEERQTNTKARLKKFFHKRPSKESLVKKGIYKDEPMFGCSLNNVVSVDTHPCVPRFVVSCIQAIECKEDNMKADGLYRASGNLSHVQKIRLQVDQNRLSVLEEEEDVHVLTGVLKLFFRELKKPLIPFEMFHKAIFASGIADRKERVSRFRALIRSLPLPNHDTLAYLLEHLVRVTKKKDFNRMHIPNIAIVFGPTLMWPEEESLNMALDLMKQNLVIESLLVDFDDIFR